LKIGGYIAMFVLFVWFYKTSTQQRSYVAKDCVY